MQVPADSLSRFGADIPASQDDCPSGLVTDANLLSTHKYLDCFLYIAVSLQQRNQCFRYKISIIFLE